MKSYTDIEQSKKLAEILPNESADNYYSWHDERYYIVNEDCPYPYSLKEKIPCWSLAALISILPLIDFTTPQLIGTPKTLYRCMYNDDLKSHAYDNPVDACCEMILKLKELKKL